MKPENTRYGIEIADILKHEIALYRQKHNLCDVQNKAVKDIISCRTQQQGGHVKKCTHCENTQQAYNSCRNRHCPKCQYIKQEKWLDKLSNNLISCKYFHVVFTIPNQLHSLMYLNPKECYGLLFKASKR